MKMFVFNLFSLQLNCVVTNMEYDLHPHIKKGLLTKRLLAGRRSAGKICCWKRYSEWLYVLWTLKRFFHPVPII